MNYIGLANDLMALCRKHIYLDHLALVQSSYGQHILKTCVINFSFVEPLSSYQVFGVTNFTRMGFLTEQGWAIRTCCCLT